MILTVDIGNTHIHLGLFIRGALRKTWTLSSSPAKTYDEYALLLHGLIGDGLPMNGAIVSSVVPRLEWPVAKAIEQEFKTLPLILDKSLPLGIINGLRTTPTEVGMDRLANAVGAYYFLRLPRPGPRFRHRHHPRLPRARPARRQPADLPRRRHHAR